jgi:hypothetical protein
VWSAHHASTLGLLRQVVAMRGGAAPDRDTDEVITLAEAAAIEQVAQILTGRAG